jgi:TPR repeat protein
MNKVLLSLVLLLSLSSAYAGSCFVEPYDVADCKVKAEQGDAQAQFNLGVMYDYGQGVTQDDKQAVKWYRKAAEQGHPSAQTSLGVMYGRGQGVRQDDKQAVKWYRKAAEQGYVQAQFNLGVRYDNGQGVIQDDVMAHMYFNIAAASGGKNSAERRGIVAKRMTPSQLEKAQDLAREWIRNH